jgi:hypothetical protein
MFHITKKNWVGEGFSKGFFVGACIDKTQRCGLKEHASMHTQNQKALVLL